MTAHPFFMPGFTEDSTPTNPTSTSPQGLGSFFSYLGNLAATVGGTLAANKLNEATAASNARIQAMLNANHQVNPATGANDPTDAQRAANRSFLEKFLPSSMLYETDPLTQNKTPSGFYYLIMAGLAALLVLFVIRMFRR